MSQESVEVVRNSFDVWNTRDVERILPLYTEDVVFHSATKDLVGETYQGKDALRQFLAELRDDMSAWKWTVEELIDAGDRVVSLHSVVTTGHASGIEVRRELAGLYEVRDGLIAIEWIYLDRDDALEAAGLSE